MYILVPMDCDDVQEAQLTKVADAEIWAQLLIEEGELVEVLHSPTFDGFENFSQAVVFSNTKEDPMPFIELGMEPLVAPMQRDIDELVEAYLFRELHDFPN